MGGHFSAASPAKHECYYCWSARRRWFSETLEELLSLIDKTPAVNEKFLARRKAKAMGDSQFDDEPRGTVKLSVEKAEEAYNDMAETGNFFELFAFARLKGIPLKEDRDEMAQEVGKRFSYEIGQPCLLP